MNRIIIVVEGGAVMSVFVDEDLDSNADVIVVDWDNDHEEQERINEHYREQVEGMKEIF